MVVKRELTFADGRVETKHLEVSKKLAKKLGSGTKDVTYTHNGKVVFARKFKAKNNKVGTKPYRDLALLEEQMLAQEI